MDKLGPPAPKVAKRKKLGTTSLDDDTLLAMLRDDGSTVEEQNALKEELQRRGMTEKIPKNDSKQSK